MFTHASQLPSNASLYSNKAEALKFITITNPSAWRCNRGVNKGKIYLATKSDSGKITIILV